VILGERRSGHLTYGTVLEPAEFEVEDAVVAEVRFDRLTLASAENAQIYAVDRVDRDQFESLDVRVDAREESHARFFHWRQHVSRQHQFRRGQA
jgi:hypothetical protein